MLHRDSCDCCGNREEDKRSLAAKRQQGARRHMLNDEPLARRHRNRRGDRIVVHKRRCGETWGSLEGRPLRRADILHHHRRRAVILHMHVGCAADLDRRGPCQLNCRRVHHIDGRRVDHIHVVRWFGGSCAWRRVLCHELSAEKNSKKRRQQRLSYHLDFSLYLFVGSSQECAHSLAPGGASFYSKPPKRHGHTLLLIVCRGKLWNRTTNGGASKTIQPSCVSFASFVIKVWFCFSYHGDVGRSRRSFQLLNLAQRRLVNLLDRQRSEERRVG